MLRTALTVLFGFAFLGLSIGYAGNSLYLFAVGTTITGVVTGWADDHLSPDLILAKRPSRRMYPQVQFKTTSGQRITFIDNHGEQSPPKKGSTVTVRYNPSKPQHAEIVSGITVYFVPAAAFALGAFCILYGLLGLRRA